MVGGYGRRRGIAAPKRTGKERPKVSPKPKGKFKVGKRK